MTNNSTILFPGSFDPFTRGHEDIVRRALKLFDRVLIAVGENIDKRSMLTTTAKIKLIADVFADQKGIEIISYSGLTTELCRRLECYNILRGVRTMGDFEYESNIDSINRLLLPQIETLILLTAPQYAAISSTAVREILHHGGRVEKFMPDGIELEKYI